MHAAHVGAGVVGQVCFVVEAREQAVDGLVEDGDGAGARGVDEAAWGAGEEV